jgi:hypothetical protein
MARPRLEVPSHGTRKRYQHRSEPCRCGACTEANAYYVAGRRRMRDALAGRRSWSQPELPPELLPRAPEFKRCGHSLMSMGARCAWCGQTVTTAPDRVPGLLVNA